MKRPARLTQAFVDAISTPGRYSDGRRAFGLTMLVKVLKDDTRIFQVILPKTHDAGW